MLPSPRGARRRGSAISPARGLLGRCSLEVLAHPTGVLLGRNGVPGRLRELELEPVVGREQAVVGGERGGQGAGLIELLAGVGGRGRARAERKVRLDQQAF